MYDTSNAILENNYGGEYEHFKMDLLRFLSVEAPVSEEEFYKINQDELAEKIYQRAYDGYKRKMDTIIKQAHPVVKNVYETQRGQYDNIIVPITDGIKVFNVLLNLEKAFQTSSKEVARAFEKQLILNTIDEHWKEQLREMDDLKQSVQNASYEQKDPLLIYKFEAYQLFRKMLEESNKNIVSVLTKAQIPIRETDEVKQAGTQKKIDMSRYSARKDEYRKAADSPESNQQNLEQKAQPVRVEKKIGRNDQIKVRYTDGRVEEGKYKKFENDLENGKAVLYE
jgi:preprotein translocase subunit SecA